MERHDHSVLDHGAHALAGVGNGNVAHLAGIHPNLALTALQHGGSESLLKLQADHSFREFYQEFFWECGEIVVRFAIPGNFREFNGSRNSLVFGKFANCPDYS